MTKVGLSYHLRSAIVASLLAVAPLAPMSLDAQEPRPDRLKPITEVNALLGERPDHYPADQAQRRFAAGCPLSRDTGAVLTTAGFEIVDLEQRYVKGPKPYSYFTRAAAIRP